MRILVVGAGAAGGFFGARLAQAGRDVTFLVRPGRAEILRRRGLRTIGVDGTETITPRLVTSREIGAPYDVVILAVKATALAGAAGDAAPAVGPGTAIVPFLNGLAHLSLLNEWFGEKSVLGGVIRVLTDLNEDGDIVQFGPMASLILGEQDGQVSPRARDLGELLDHAGFEVAVSNAILAAMWHKWVFIASLGALTCLMRGPVGDIAAVPGGTTLAEGLVAEAAAASEAAGYPVPPGELAATRAMLTQPGSPLASSMYRDLTAGRPTEVEHVLADLGARARAMSVSTPLFDLATLNVRIYQRRVEHAG